MNKLLKVPEVAELLSCSESNVYSAVSRGELQAYRVGAGRGGLRFSMEQIEAYLKNRETATREDRPKTAIPSPSPTLKRLTLS